MNEKDDIILEYLEAVGVAEPPAVIHWNLVETGPHEFSVRTLRRRLARLSEANFVKIVNEEGRYYEIADNGLAYLDGDLEAPELE